MFTRIKETVQVAMLCLIPFWIWLAMYLLIAPDSAVARVLVVGLGLWFFGVIQLVGLGILVLMLGEIWKPKVKILPPQQGS